MEQFYFLSIVMNLLAGYAIILTNAPDKGTAFDGVRHYLNDVTVDLSLVFLQQLSDYLSLS